MGPYCQPPRGGPRNAPLLCGVANSSSSDLSRVVETRWSWPCKPINGLPMYIHFMHCLHLYKEDQAVAQDHAIFHGSPPVTWPPDQNFKASNWLQ